jgi:serine/threonine protein kinase/sugar lactone lactonase YvrE
VDPERWREIERLYHAALERDPADRAAYLCDACHNDAELRREVEELLAYQDRANGFIETPAIHMVARQEAAVLTSEARFRLAVGAHLGPYEILQPIGAGGMGEVYRARDTRLGRSVALKIVAARMAEQAGIRRLEREARAISSLNHPHICALHDIGREGDLDFLVMEYVEGPTLAARLRVGRLPLADVLRAGIEIVEALDYAHRQGIVHRDLKPANIMLTASGAKLVDFGLARRPEQLDELSGGLAPGNAANLTMTGMVLGTPQYMAPEQIAHGGVDARTDIFAFGAVLFEMAHARKAFTGDTATEVVEAIRKRTAPAIARRESGVPAALDRLIQRCLKSAPAERWQSAGEVLRELQRIQRRKRTVKPIVWAGAVALCVVLAIGAFFLARSLRAAPRARTTLAPGQELVATFTTVPNSADLLFFSSNTPLTTTGSPTITASLFSGDTLLGTYTQTSANVLQVAFESPHSRFRSPGAVGPTPTPVDFTGVNGGNIRGRLVVTVAGGSIGLDPREILFYDAVSLDPFKHRIASDLKAAGFPALVSPPVPSARIVEYPVPTPHSDPKAITHGPDGAIWFTEYETGKIGRITTVGAITEYVVPSPDAHPSGIVTGPDGALWFAEGCGNRIGRITTAGAIREYPLHGFSCLAEITAGPDGALWFAGYGSNNIGRITTTGSVTAYNPPGAGAPFGIAAGPDGALWFAEHDANKIGRITTAGIVTEYAVPAGNAGPLGITVGPDGGMWFTQGPPKGDRKHGRSCKIGRITTTGVFGMYPLDADRGPYGITAGPDGSPWFAQWQSDEIGRISRDGVVTEFPLTGYDKGPIYIAAGPDSVLWFTESVANKIGRLVAGSSPNPRQPPARR